MDLITKNRRGQATKLLHLAYSRLRTRADDSVLTMLRSNLALMDQQRAYDTVPPSRRSLGADDARSAPLNPDELSRSSDSLLSTRNPVDDWKRLAALLLPANLEATVPAGTPIVIVPHGTIGLLPFAALTVGRDRFAATRRASIPAGARRTSSVQRVVLGTRNPLRYAPSFTALRASEARPRVAVAQGRRGAAGSVASSALLVGNPAMPFVDSGRWTTRSRLRSLPGAEAESQRIGTLLGVRTLTGKTATESAVRRRMVDAPLIISRRTASGSAPLRPLAARSWRSHRIRCRMDSSHWANSWMTARSPCGPSESC